MYVYVYVYECAGVYPVCMCVLTTSRMKEANDKEMDQGGNQKCNNDFLMNNEKE